MPVHTKDLRIETVAVSSLRPYARNPRTHTKKQIRQIADSIRTFGWTNPILVDAEGGVIAGHGRLEAAKLLGIEHVPTIRLEDMSEAQKRAYVIADNRLAEIAGWDDDLLAVELQALCEIDLDFDIEITGFEMADIDTLIAGLNGANEGDEVDRLPDIDETAPPITRLGDLWLLGRHRLLCADATKAESYARLLAGEQAQMVFTDPPYNVPIDGHVCGLGSVKHTEFAMASGEMSETEFTGFLETVLGQLAAHSVNGAIHFVCMDWRHLYELLTAGRAVYSEIKNLCVWNKTNGGMGSLYRSKHELVVVFKAGKGPHINNVELGVHGRYRTNVWDYAGINTFGKDRDAELAMHPTVKPVALVEDAILDCSRRGGIVLDAFSGSGTTIIAAERSARRGFGLELDPKYIDATLKRFRALTGEEPVHADSGLTLGELE
jgi:DNA modification methylase